MAKHILRAQRGGQRRDTRANDKEGGLELLLLKVVEQLRAVDRWAVVEGRAPCFLLLALDNVSLPQAVTARPPALGRITDAGLVRRAEAVRVVCEWLDVGDDDTTVADFIDPFDDLVAGDWRDLV